MYSSLGYIVQLRYDACYAGILRNTEPLLLQVRLPCCLLVPSYDKESPLKLYHHMPPRSLHVIKTFMRFMSDVDYYFLPNP
jgi:hypothetical protein